MVADAVAATSPAWSKTEPVALVSPEKAGPTRPMVNASSTICGAMAVAFCGSPSVSKVFSWTWQPGLAAMCAAS